jgi:hypothetical protein
MIQCKLNRDDKKVHIIKGVMYRVKLTTYVTKDRDGGDFKILAYSLPQSYHKYTAYRNAGDLIYHGISLKEAWEVIRSYVGHVKIPDELKELQPFITQQL